MQQFTVFVVTLYSTCHVSDPFFKKSLSATFALTKTASLSIFLILQFWQGLLNKLDCLRLLKFLSSKGLSLPKPKV